jgi:hypothetical protein
MIQRGIKAVVRPVVLQLWQFFLLVFCKRTSDFAKKFLGNAASEQWHKDVSWPSCYDPTRNQSCGTVYSYATLAIFSTSLAHIHRV